MNQWSVRDAKARFSELLREAQKKPQRIAVRGELTAIVVSENQYRRLCENSVDSKKTFAEWWKSAPRAPEFELPPRE
jgi:prevent-host-death family protein